MERQLSRLEITMPEAVSDLTTQPTEKQSSLTKEVVEVEYNMTNEKSRSEEEEDDDEYMEVPTFVEPRDDDDDDDFYSEEKPWLLGYDTKSCSCYQYERTGDCYCPDYSKSFQF